MTTRAILEPAACLGACGQAVHCAVQSSATLGRRRAFRRWPGGLRGGGLPGYFCMATIVHIGSPIPTSIQRIRIASFAGIHPSRMLCLPPSVVSKTATNRQKPATRDAAQATKNVLLISTSPPSPALQRKTRWFRHGHSIQQLEHFCHSCSARFLSVQGLCNKPHRANH